MIQDRSLSTNGAWAAAERAEDESIQLYVMGLDIDDTMELDETPSHPLSTYQYLTRNEREVMEVPDKIRATLPPSKYITSYENVNVYFQQYISDSHVLNKQESPRI
jgi:hypothetical protein